MSIGWIAHIKTPIVRQELVIRFNKCQDKRKKWRRRRDKWIDRAIKEIRELAKGQDMNEEGQT